MNKTQATQAIRRIDAQIDAARRSKNQSLEQRLFELRGWYQLVRDTANSRWDKRDHDKAVAKVTELEVSITA